MKPTAAETDRGMPATANPKTPPMRAKGTLSRTMRQSWTEPNSEKSKRNVNNSARGMTSLSRDMARTWFSNSPPQVIS